MNSSSLPLVYLFFSRVLLNDAWTHSAMVPITWICLTFPCAFVSLLHFQTYALLCGWFKFQVDLRIALVNYAIHEEWRDLNGPFPKWMDETGLLYSLQLWRMLFFWLNGLTNGIGHMKECKVTMVVRHHDNSWTVTTLVLHSVLFIILTTVSILWTSNCWFPWTSKFYFAVLGISALNVWGQPSFKTWPMSL
jgi:hypothetical protein